MDVATAGDSSVAVDKDCLDLEAVHSRLVRERIEVLIANLLSYSEYAEDAMLEEESADFEEAAVVVANSEKGQVQEEAC